MRRAALQVSSLSLVLVAACAPRTAPLPVVTSPRFPDFVAPVVPAAFANQPWAARQTRGWTFLQAGDLRNAEREFSIALKAEPTFFPAEIGLGYVELGDREPKTALTRFERVLERQVDASALVGRGVAYLDLDREADALVAFEAAVAADPSLTQIAQRVEVLKFRNVEQRIAEARAAAEAGRLDAAIRAYTAAVDSSPGSPFLYRELAAVERQRGDNPAALAHYRTALGLDAADVESLTAIGEILETTGDFDGAVREYSAALAIEPSSELVAKLEAARGRVELARLPEQFRAIDAAPQITRGELAALIGVRLAPLLQPDARVEAEPITDVRTDWAAPWILTVSRAGVMEPFANHAFQPDSAVRRIDLAQAVERLLMRIAPLKPEEAQRWDSASVQFTDLATGHLAYPAASAAVASGILTAEPDGTFQPSQVVSGEQAVRAIERLQQLAGLPSIGAARR
ncbi:MAG TPA: tetratricopeptide repeat protein [Vicinamibacterales bacterium]|nr:tetratricopeptide repeat protein [Vicinamibacterales bacterium]